MSKRKRNDYSEEYEEETISDDDEEQVKSPHDSNDDDDGDNEDSSSHSSNDDNNDESNNPFLIKGLKTQLNDQPDEIINQIFTFINPNHFLPLSMVSHKFRTCWKKTPSAIMHKWQSRMNRYIYQSPKELDLLQQVKQSMKKKVKTVFSKAMHNLKVEKLNMETKERIATLLERCEQNDKERTTRLMSILKRITAYTLEDKDSYYNDTLMWYGAEMTLTFDGKHSYYLTIKRGDHGDSDSYFSGGFWENVAISKEDMLWLVQLAFDLSQLSYVRDVEITMDYFD